MDYRGILGGDNNGSAFNLVYPLSVEFDQREPLVRLHTLDFGVLNIEHLNEPRRKLRENDVFLFKRTLSIPWQYNLYILVNVREESYNVNFLTVLLRQAFDVNRSVKIYSERHKFTRSAYRNDNWPCENNNGEAQASRKRKHRKLGESNVHQKTELSMFPDTGCTRKAKNDNNETAMSIKLTLALRDVETSVTSLYDFSSLFGDRFDYERCQHRSVSEDNGVFDDFPDNQRQSMTNESNMKFKRTNNLYVCSFDNLYDFQVALHYLINNCANWTDIYDMPVGLDDDCIRFSLDMFIRNVQFEHEVQLRRRRYELISSSGLRSNTRAHLSHLKMDDRAILINDEATTDIDDALDPEVLLERAFATGFKCGSTTATGQSNRAATEEEDPQKQRIDIFSCFSMANWSVYNSNTRLVTNIDRHAFERLLIKSNASFFQSLDGPFSRQRFDQLYDTPLLFVPSIVWDIETIARNPCTIPRGVAEDESLVSIALVIERPAVDSLRLSVVWVLVPDWLDQEERKQIAKQSLLRVEHEHDLHASPTVICYTDERAMLYDFCALMRINFLVLHTYLGISVSNLSAYRDLCTFLIGHNSVGYDYAFILNRCLFFGFDDMCMHLTRKMGNAPGMSREINALYTFNNAQICIDTLLFLRARMRHLSAFDLRSVLRFYHCDIPKLDLDATQIRHFYHTLFSRADVGSPGLGQLTTREHYAALRVDTRLKYFAAFLRYNVFDCLSLCDLLAKLAFVQYFTTLMRCFSVPLESAIYCGNSRLLPSILINDCLREKREFLVPTHENQSIFSIDRCGRSFINEFRSWLKEHASLPRSKLAISFEYQRFLDCFSLSIPSHYMHHVYNPYIEFVEYMRTIRWTNTISETDGSEPGVTDKVENDPLSLAFHKSADWQLDPDRFHSFTTLSLPCDRQLDLLRIGEKTYVGGMNYAEPCHVKHPILMDYNSFYPSIIRHYELDINNVAIFTVKKLLLSIRPIILLEEIIKCRVLRIFDYTSLQDVDIYVNRVVFTSANFHTLFTPKNYSRREWHEGIEIDSLDLLLASSRSLERRVLVLMKKMDDSVIDHVVTQALLRRAEWKKKKQENPNDKIVQSRELMDKLLANGTYGYLNYCKSVTFSRPTAAAVTLLCRNTFSRTRFIIESNELLRSLHLDPCLFSAHVIYIDTDGCIVFIRKKSAAGLARNAQDITHLFNVNQPLMHLDKSLRVSLPPFDLSPSPECKMRNLPSKVILDPDRDLPLLHINKTLFVKQINQFLNMQHVTLAAEHHDAVAASVFTTKKYSLYKVETLSPPRDKVKKTGFESNAPLPVKALYDIVLRNFSLLNHGYYLVHADRFICKIVRHRAFFYAIFDTLYQWWQDALVTHDKQVKRERERFCGTHHDSNDTPESFSEGNRRFKLIDFTTRIPLNPKENSGKMAEFIDHVLSEFKYDIGDRVRMLKLAPIDAANATVLDTPDGQYILYNLTDTRFELFDIVQENLHNVIPDFKYFLGGHASYIYQCIEGCQTLRERSSSQREPVEWSTMGAFFCHLQAMQENGYVNASCNPEATTYKQNEKETLYLRSFNALYDLNYATWLWQRILSKRIDRHLHNRVLILWNSHIKTEVKKIAQDAHDGKAAFRNLLCASMTSKDIPCAPPKILSSCFFKKWFTSDSEAFDRLVFDALFNEPKAIASAEDIAAKTRLINSGAILYKRL